MTGHKQRLHPVGAPRAASVKDKASFLELVNFIVGIRDVAIDLANICIHGFTSGLC